MKRIYSSHWSDYELIDAGNDKKLERWGEIITIRPDRNAYFSPILSQKDWKHCLLARTNSIVIMLLNF